MGFERRELTDEVLLKAIELLTHQVGKRIEKHGRGAFVSNHEALGVMTEEYHELVGAVTSNDPMRVAEEMMDVAVSGVIAVASMVAGAKVEPTQCTCDPSKNEGCTDCPATETPKPQFTDMDAVADRARQLMIERAQKSNLIIASKLDG
jgi:hypothetical protein